MCGRNGALMMRRVAEEVGMRKVATWNRYGGDRLTLLSLWSREILSEVLIWIVPWVPRLELAAKYSSYPTPAARH